MPGPVPFTLRHLAWSIAQEENNTQQFRTKSSQSQTERRTIFSDLIYSLLLLFHYSDCFHECHTSSSQRTNPSLCPWELQGSPSHLELQPTMGQFFRFSGLSIFFPPCTGLSKLTSNSMPAWVTLLSDASSWSHFLRSFMFHSLLPPKCFIAFLFKLPLLQHPDEHCPKYLHC